MADFVTLTCPSCGGKLQITNDTERFACERCGTEHLVKRGGGVISLAPVFDKLEKVHTSVDKATAELAITRIKEEIVELERRKTSMFVSVASSRNANYLALLLAAIGLTCYFAFLSIQTPVFGLIAIALMIATPILCGGLYLRDINRNTEGVRAITASWEQKISEKQDELDKYYKIISDSP